MQKGAPYGPTLLLLPTPLPRAGNALGKDFLSQFTAKALSDPFEGAPSDSYLFLLGW